MFVCVIVNLVWQLVHRYVIAANEVTLNGHLKVKSWERSFGLGLVETQGGVLEED